MNGRRFSSEEDARLLELWKQGVPYERIAEQFGRTVGACMNRVYRLRRGMGVTRPRPEAPVEHGMEERHRCCGCGRPTPDHRCPACLAEWRRKHGVSEWLKDVEGL